MSAAAAGEGHLSPVHGDFVGLGFSPSQRLKLLYERSEDIASNESELARVCVQLTPVAAQIRAALSTELRVDLSIHHSVSRALSTRAVLD